MVANPTALATVKQQDPYDLRPTTDQSDESDKSKSRSRCWYIPVVIGLNSYFEQGLRNAI